MSEYPLPIEVIVIIIRIVTTQSRSTAVTLRLVSKWVQEEVDPLLYRTLVLRTESPEECTRLLTRNCTTHLQCFGLNQVSLTTNLADAALDTLSLLHPKPRVRNIMMKSLRDDVPDILPFIEELHIWCHNKFALTALPCLRRIHYLRPKFVDWTDPTAQSGHYRTLTHLAFTFGTAPSPHHINLAEHLRTVLEIYPALLMVVVRLHCYWWVNGEGKTYTKNYSRLAETLDALRAIPDNRLIVIVFHQYQSYTIWQGFEEWERGAGDGKSLWEEATAVVLAHNHTNTATPEVVGGSPQKPYIVELKRPHPPP